MTIYIISTGLTHYGINIAGVFTSEDAAEVFARKQDTIRGEWRKDSAVDRVSVWLDDADGMMTIEQWDAQ